MKTSSRSAAPIRRNTHPKEGACLISTSSKDNKQFCRLELLAAPAGIDRRAFLMRHAAIGAAAAMTGTAWTAEARVQQAATEASAQQVAKEAAKDGAGLKMSAALSPDLDVVKK